MVRNFFIENELGQRFSLMDVKNGCFLNSPNGLGYSYNIEYSQIGNNFIQNIKKISQGQIFGELVFANYENYKKFVDFVESSTKLKIVYRVPLQNGYSEYFKDIDIANIEKGEKNKAGLLIAPVSFNVKSLWYEPKEIVYTIDSVTNELRWDFAWDTIFSAYDNRNIVFENKGHEEAPFKLELNGEVVNPIITILENDIEVKKLDLTGLIIDEGETFIYNTKDTEQQIIKTGNNGIINLFSFLNPNFINFYKLRKGVSTIRLEADGEITSGKLTIYVQYKAV